jgi:methoxylated aromatic compound---corrinoid protein Co-methyltransferase
VGLVKSAMAMSSYFAAFGPQVARMRAECGTVSAIAGIFKAPLDILADKLRGYLGLLSDLEARPDKVLRACEALMPHLCHMGLTTADPDRLVPIGFWMHRGCVPFITPQHFERFYWPTLKPIIEEFWKQGHQTLFYAEGKWGYHYQRFAELPARSIVLHVDRDDVLEAHRQLHAKFAISGGIPNALLSFGRPEEVRAFVKKILEQVAGDGGYILDAGAIMQNDTSIENLRAMTDCAREHGLYSSGHIGTDATPPADLQASIAGRAQLAGMADQAKPPIAPGVCLPWSGVWGEIAPIAGDVELVRRIWEQVDSQGNSYIWQLLLSF